MNGDFNLPIIRWESLEVYGGSADARQQAKLLLDFADEFMLIENITQPTRGNNLLDLFFTSIEELLYNIRLEDTIMSDHRLLIVETTLGFPVQTCENKPRDGIFSSLNFYRENVEWECINTALMEVNWQQLMKNLSPEDMYHILCRELSSVCEKFVPIRSYKKNRRFIPRDRKILMRKRTRLAKRIMATRDANLKIRLANSLQLLESKLSASHEREKNYAEQRAVEAIKRNPKFFYKYVREKAKVRSTIGPLKVDDYLVGDTGRVCEILRSQYDSVFSEPLSEDALRDMDGRSRASVHHGIMDVMFNEDNIAEAVVTVQQHDSLCVLPLNIVNEKTYYVFLWIVYIFAAIVCGVFLLFLLPSLRNTLLVHRARRPETIHDLMTVLLKCNYGDWFLMYNFRKSMVYFREWVHLVKKEILM
ncbi:hypothetical protein Pmani_015149 [Petrolisthes manimaculis]|uniref:Reverse transcriptase n=1 Tax=Petrolisthes manimaculis TaxID=1843537 RepID=A0AAE1PUA2_9EUCA|nr:hypothetical protein Pmani_015149 [Petrolisthes manimaculis]